MPNWTDVTLRCDGLSELPIFTTDERGEMYFDYNKIVPMPEYTKDTISPVREDCILTYLLKENFLKDALSKFKDYGFILKDEFKSLDKEHILEMTDKPENLGYLDNSKEISAYDLGKNYVTSHEETGCWDWYNWAYNNWGVKWNSSDCYLDGDTLSFMAPWRYPDKVFEKLTEMFPDKNFYAEIIYEDDFETIHTLDFSADHYYEGEEINPSYIDELEDNLTFKLGLYNQTNISYPAEMNESKVYGIAIQAIEDDEPKCIITTNLPSRMGDFCEMISIKNAAYIDVNNNPWATALLERGIARDTGYTKQSGFCEYPLYQFDEDWLKSLEPIDNSRTYADYEKKYNEAMNIDKEEKDMNVDYLRKQYPEGTRIKLGYMEGEDLTRMYNGLMGTVKFVDDIGQIHVSWDNGSSLALSPDDDSFETVPEREKITVLNVSPGNEPKVVEIYNDLESLQAEVGGLIECVYPFDDDACIIVNEEGKIEGLPLNRALRDDDGNIYDIVAGNMLIVGTTEDDFGSLTAGQIEVYSESFREPELIYHLDTELKVIPANDYSQYPLYYKSIEEARELGEREAYRASFRANVACSKAIENSTAENYKDNVLDVHSVFNEVTEKFGEERVKMVLANTCLDKSWDGRIDRRNVEWAQSITLPDGKNDYGDETNKYFVCEKPHIGLIDLVASKARRKDERANREERESVLDKLKINQDKVKEQSKDNPSKAKENGRDL